MEDMSPCPFWPQNIGPYMTELSQLYCELNNVLTLQKRPQLCATISSAFLITLMQTYPDYVTEPIS